ncbi:MAG: hypothetical protein KGI50_03470 [Patescibacteria group bacterium]|nr:hypothetical protein [Patescibacteria group bacterium]MDE2438351.1 hypothetical protein [Patescibacteria group bacterium]
MNPYEGKRAKLFLAIRDQIASVAYQQFVIGELDSTAFVIIALDMNDPVWGEIAKTFHFCEEGFSGIDFNIKRVVIGIATKGFIDRIGEIVPSVAKVAANPIPKGYIRVAVFADSGILMAMMPLPSTEPPQEKGGRGTSFSNN